MPGCKFRQSCFIENVVLLAVGYNLRNLFACHHKKNVFREGSHEDSGFNDGRHRRLTEENGLKYKFEQP